MLTSEQARKPLCEYAEGLIALGLIGGPFASHAAYQLTTYVNTSKLSFDVQYELLRSALNRKDRMAARMFINDWNSRDFGRRRACVSKWTPGDHYYALEEKFGTLALAVDHLKKCGYEYERLIEKHVYDTTGD